MQDWSEVKPGDVITVQRLGYRNNFKIRVESVDAPINPDSAGRFVRGQRLTMAGTPSRRLGERGPDGRKRPRTMFYVFDGDVREIA